MKKQKSFICPFCKKEQTSIIEVEKAEIYYSYNFETQEHDRDDEEEFLGNAGYYCPNCDKKINYNLIKEFYD